MLADAFAAEFYKFLRNHSTLFWGFCAAPLGVLLFNLALDTYLKSRVHLPLTIDTGRQIVTALGLAGSSFLQIFFAAGAAAIFAGEYHWETWRLLTPRNSRSNLLAAKFLVYALACVGSLTALALAAILQSVYGAALGSTLILPGANFLSQAAWVFFISLLELLVLGTVAALVAVASRAMIGALLTAMFFSFAQSIAMAVIHPWDAPLKDFLYLPSMCAYLIRAWATGQEVAPGVLADPAKILPALAILAAWIVMVGGAALARFQYQDLSRE